jgi:hypothetical protein
MLQGEAWQGMGEFDTHKHYRQRVRARRRPDNKATIQEKSITRGARAMLKWLLRRWLP